MSHFIPVCAKLASYTKRSYYGSCIYLPFSCTVFIKDTVSLYRPTSLSQSGFVFRSAKLLASKVVIQYEEVFPRVFPLCMNNFKTFLVLVMRLLTGMGHKLIAWPTTWRARRCNSSGLSSKICQAWLNASGTEVPTGTASKITKARKRRGEVKWWMINHRVPWLTRLDARFDVHCFLIFCFFHSTTLFCKSLLKPMKRTSLYLSLLVAWVLLLSSVS